MGLLVFIIVSIVASLILETLLKLNNGSFQSLIVAFISALLGGFVSAVIGTSTGWFIMNMEIIIFGTILLVLLYDQIRKMLIW